MAYGSCKYLFIDFIVVCSQFITQAPHYFTKTDLEDLNASQRKMPKTIK